jgi:trigger factor
MAPFCGRSSVVEHHVANVRVVSSNLIARYLNLETRVTQSSIENQELKNEFVSVKAHRKPDCQIELEVHAAPSLMQKARRAAIKKVGKEIVVPGFRKGKAPEEMVLKKYSVHVDREQKNELADLAFIEAQKLTRIPLLNNNAKITYQLHKETEEGAHLSFVFDTEPTVPEVDIAAFQPQAVAMAEVGDTQIDEAIRQLSFYYADWKPLERPIREGDYIMIDLDTVEHGVPTQVFHHVRFEVSEARMAQWMKRLVIGAMPGASIEGISEADETASEEEKREFNPKQVRITIVKAEEATLPPIDDAFAAKMGAPDVATMRQSITSALKAQAEEKVEGTLREQVNRFLIEAYPFDLPRSLLETEKNHRMNQLLEDPGFKKKWDAMPLEERKKVEDRVAAEATDAVRLFYLSRDTVRRAGLLVTHKELQQEAVATLRASNPQAHQVSQEHLALAFSKVMLKKAQDHILKKNQ